MTDEKWKTKFQAWKDNVDRCLIDIAGVFSDDIEDWNYADDFDAGMSPLTCAKRAIQNSTAGCDF